MVRAAVDALVFSSAWVAIAAGALCAAASLALGTAPAVSVVGIAVAGTLLVYNVDRLRDLERDRATAPERSAFVARHRRALVALAAAAALASAGLASALGWLPLLMLALVLALGLFHRRLKRLPLLKSAYLTLAWVAVTVALPALHAGATLHAGWIASVLALAVFANAVAFNVRDREAAAARFGRRRSLWLARAVAALGIGAGAASPPPVRALLAVPAATLAALIPFRGDERYVAVFVDGALVAGAAVAAWLSCRGA